MTNLLSVLPDFDIRPFTHVLPSLEKALISTPDLLTLDALDVAKRAQLPPGEVKKLGDAVRETVHSSIHVRGDVFPRGSDVTEAPPSISTLDARLDRALNGGIARGHLTEIVGESAAGKTQFLLTLLLSVQLSTDDNTSALYISTEAPLQTTRLMQILSNHPKLRHLATPTQPALGRIQSTHVHDVEAQEHILRYQVPVAIRKQNIGLLVVDSIAANYRAEFDKLKVGRGAESFAKRGAQIAQVGTLLRDIARTHNIAVVVANQVADRFTVEQPGQGFTSQSTQRSRPASPPQSIGARSGNFSQTVTSEASESLPNGLSTDDPLALDHQQRFFTGWGDDPAITNYKTPSLGLTWTNQLSTRIALLREPIYEEKVAPMGEERSITGWKRTAKAVFSAWCAESATDFEIWEGGIRSLGEEAGPGG